MDKKRTLWSDLVTESDNITYDVYRYMALLSVLAAIVLAAYNVIVLRNAFDVQQFGIGIGSLLAGAGTALFLKGKVETS